MSVREYENSGELGDWRPFEVRVIGWHPEPEDNHLGRVAISLEGPVTVTVAASPAQARAFADALRLAASAAEALEPEPTIIDPASEPHPNEVLS